VEVFFFDCRQLYYYLYLFLGQSVQNRLYIQRNFRKNKVTLSQVLLTAINRSDFGFPLASFCFSALQCTCIECGRGSGRERPKFKFSVDRRVDLSRWIFGATADPHPPANTVLISRKWVCSHRARGGVSHASLFNYCRHFASA